MKLFVLSLALATAAMGLSHLASLAVFSAWASVLFVYFVATAFVATVYGVAFANIVFLPAGFIA